MVPDPFLTTFWIPSLNLHEIDGMRSREQSHCIQRLILWTSTHPEIDYGSSQQLLFLTRFSWFLSWCAFSIQLVCRMSWRFYWRPFDYSLIRSAIFQESRTVAHDIHTLYFLILVMMRQTHVQHCFTGTIICICSKIMLLLNNSAKPFEWP